MITKNKLAIELSKIEPFKEPNLILEQYNLDSETAANILWTAYMNNDVKKKTIADLGAGTGILGYGCLILEAKKVFLVDKDNKALTQAKNKIKSKKAVFINKDVKDFNEPVDIVIQNPPFGTKIKHSDKTFLEKAMKISDKIYSIHKITSKKFIESLSKDHDFKVVSTIPISLNIKNTYSFHKKPKKQISLGIWILEKQKFKKPL